MSFPIRWLTRALPKNQTRENRFIWIHFYRVSFMFNNNIFFFGFSVYVGEGLRLRVAPTASGMSFSLTWRVKMRDEDNSCEDQVEKSHPRSLRYFFFSSLCPLPTSARCFCLSSTPGIKCKKSIFMLFQGVLFALWDAISL